MTRINLLPWREQLRKDQERQFYTMLAGAVVVMAIVVVYAHFHMVGLINGQNARNGYLEGEIQVVEGRIKEIQALESEKGKLLARMRIIEQLQGQRPQVVHLFDELVSSLPEGVYLTSVKQTGSTIVIEGIAQSNARVSAFMRSIDESPWLENPRLNVIEALGKDNQRTSKFMLEIKQTIGAAPKPEEAGANS